MSGHAASSVPELLDSLGSYPRARHDRWNHHKQLSPVEGRISQCHAA